MFFKRKKEPKNIEEVLTQFNSLQKEFKELQAEFNNLEELNKINIQKIGIVRFNPFSEIGGDQSFALALLDGKDDGVVITNFYTREGSRVYGKPIKKGKSKYQLSKEEVKAINKAKGIE